MHSWSATWKQSHWHGVPVFLGNGGHLSVSKGVSKHSGWPKQKGITYIAVGDRWTADLLARQWCRRGNYFCALWHAHDCADDFHFTEADKPEENLEFVQWMSSIQEDDFLWDHYAMPAWSCRPVS